jgi:hypothetical protein
MGQLKGESGQAASRQPFADLVIQVLGVFEDPPQFQPMPGDVSRILG